jgi:hypothetical protein
MKSETDIDDYGIINILISKPIINENVVSHYIIKHYNKNIINELSTLDFLEILKKSFKYFMELLDAINELKCMALQFENKENELFFKTIEKLKNNVSNDKNKLITVCKRFCSLSPSTRSQSNILSKVQVTIMKKQYKIIPCELKELLNTKKYFNINKYIIGSYNKISVSDCIGDIKKCCIFYTQLINSVNDIVYALDENKSSRKEMIRNYLNMIIKKLNEDYNCLKEIEDNLISLYRVNQFKC